MTTKKGTLEWYLERLTLESDKMLNAYEKSLASTYRALLRDMQNSIANVYSKIDDNDMMNSLRKYHRKENIEKTMASMIDELSKTKYKGMYNQLRDQLLFSYKYYYEALTTVSGKDYKLTPLKTSWIRAIIENEDVGTKLKEVVQKDRVDLIYKVKSNLIQGVNNGESYSTMAKRMQKVVNNDYQKAVRIARTETHRVKNVGTQKSAEQGQKAGIKQMKEWVCMNDSRARKNHRRLDGKKIPVDEYFRVGSGKALVPGETGRAEEDINCRCICVYSIADE